VTEMDRVEGAAHDPDALSGHDGSSISCRSSG
jgi:hypothetical protein